MERPLSQSHGDVAGIEPLVHKYASNFLRNDGEAQLDLWDRDYPNLTLLPSERSAPLRTWAQIQEFYLYWTGSEGGPQNKIRRWEVTEVITDRLSDDLAFALASVTSEYDMAVEVPTDALFPGYGGENGLWIGRLSFILRDTDSGWKIIHYEDSTQDLFRARQLWEYHKQLATHAFELLKPILNPPHSLHSYD